MIIYSQTAQAIPKPSWVLVPLPSSSIKTRDWEEADSSMDYVSIISFMNVDIPFIYLSLAPTLVIMAFIIGN